MKNNNINREFKDIFVGKKKESVCRLSENTKSNIHKVNNKELSLFFKSTPYHLMEINNILNAFPIENFWFQCRIKGGGISSHATSIIKSLGKFLKHYYKKIYKNDQEKFNEMNCSLRKAGLLTNDTRKVESKSPGGPKARASRSSQRR